LETVARHLRHFEPFLRVKSLRDNGIGFRPDRHTSCVYNGGAALLASTVSPEVAMLRPILLAGLLPLAMSPFSNDGAPSAKSAGVVGRTRADATPICATYITITQYPTNPYYQATANITVEWGDIITVSPHCVSGEMSDPGTFVFTVNGVDRTSYFTIDGTGATGTNVPLVGGVLNTLVASIQGNDTGGNPRTDTDTRTTFVMAGGQPMAPFVEPSAGTAGPIVERDLCLTIAAGSDAAYECGDLRVVHPLPSVRTLGRQRTPTLIYNSDHAYPFPLVAANVTLPTGAQVPDSVVAALTITGQGVRGTAKWPGTQWSAGQARRIVLGFSALTDAAGVYGYSVQVTNYYGQTGYTSSSTATGQLVIVNRSKSPFGAGWWLAGLERLNPGTMFWVGGDGSARIYSPVTANVWAAPNVDRPDTLKWSPSASRYVRYLPHGVQVRFDAAGRHMETINRTRDTTYFAYLGSSDTLQGITLPPTSAGVGYVFDYTYYADFPLGRLLRSVTAPGTRLTFLTMNAGRVTDIRDPDGTRVYFGYDATATQRVRTRTDRRGTVTKYTFFGNKLASDTIPTAPGQLEIMTTFAPAEVAGWAGGTGAVDTANAYTLLDGPRVDVVDQSRFWLDRFGAPRRIQDPLGNVTQLWRTSGMWPAAVTRTVRYLSPDSQVVRATYDNMGLVSTVTDSSNCQGGQCATTSYQYDPKWGFVTLITNPEGDLIRMAYDSATGHRMWQEDSRGSQSRVSFYYGNSLQLLSRVQTPSATSADSLEYDTRGNVSRRVTALGYATTIENDGLGFPWRVTSPEGVQTTTYRDSSAERDTLVVTSGPARSIAGDPFWNPLSWSALSASVKKTYDPEGNLIETRRWSSTGDIGTVIERTQYDLANRPVATVAADGLKDSVVYNPAGNAVRLITRRNHLIDQDFDAAGRLTQRRTPTISYAAQTFQGASFPAKTIPGDTARYFYDAAGRVTLAVNRYARTQRDFSRGGQLLREEQRLRSWSARAYSTWNAAGFDQHIYTVGYAYDLDGRRTIVAHPSQLGPGNDTTRFAYYRFGPDSTVTDPYGGVFRFLYDAEGRLDSLYYPNTTGEKRGYDPDGRLQFRTVRSPTSTVCGTGSSGSCFPNNVIRADTIAYSPDGQIVDVWNAGREAFQIDYNGLGQVARSIQWYFSTSTSSYRRTRSEFFWPDALGNMIRRSVVTSPPDVPKDTLAYDTTTGRLSQQADLFDNNWGWQPASHDSSGNLRFTARYQLGSECVDGDSFRCNVMWSVRYQTVTAYWYDADQRLVASHRKLPTTSGPNSDMVGGQEQYWYDALGRRILRYWLSDDIVEFGVAYVEPHMYRYVWDGSQILYEIRTQASVQCVDIDIYCLANDYGRVGYVHGPALDTPLEAFRADGYLEFSRMFLHPDWRGTITLGSRQNGEQDAPPLQMVDWRRYNISTYGERQSAFYNVNWRWFGSFLSRQVDGSKLQYLRNRYYDANNGRFTQEDPIGLAGGLNLYGFGGGDPVNFSDPFGLCIEDLCIGETVAIGVVAFAGVRALFNLATGRPVTEGVVRDAQAGFTSGVLAAAGGLATRAFGAARAGAAGVGAAGGKAAASEVSQGALNAMERQFARNGATSLRSTIRSLTQRIARHEADMAEYRAAGGNVRSMEVEVRAWRQTIQVARRVLEANQ
jgi:RHS repeat-associated protein